MRLSLLCLLVASGCALTPEEFCAQYQSAYAARVFDCVGGSAKVWQTEVPHDAHGPGTTGWHLPPSDCAAVKRAVAAKRLGFDAKQASACLSALGKAPCATFTADPPAACAAALTGKVAVSGQCFWGLEECAGGYCNLTHSVRLSAADCPGVCLPTLKPGDACTVGGVGVCPAGSICTSGTCVSTTAGPGQSCDLNRGPWCLTGLYCDSATQTCTVPSATSGPCTVRTSQGGLSECAPKFRCLGPAGAQSCTALKALGASCTTGNGECQLGLYCADGGTCIEAPFSGESCAPLAGEPVTCVGSTCDPSVAICAASGVGSACTPQFDQCDPGLFCDGSASTCAAACAEP